MPHCARGVGPNCMGLSILDKLPWLQLLACNTLGRVTVAIKTAKLQLCILKQSCIDVHWSTMSTWTIWTCAKQYHDIQPRPRLLAKLWRAYSQDFIWVAVYFVEQVELSKWKGSFLWAAYSSLDFGSLTMTIKVHKSRRNSRTKP